MSGKGLENAPFQGDITEITPAVVAGGAPPSWESAGNVIKTSGAYALHFFVRLTKGTNNITALSFRALLQRSLAGGAADAYPEPRYDPFTDQLRDKEAVVDVTNNSGFVTAGTSMLNFVAYTYGAPYVRLQTKITNVVGGLAPVINSIYVHHLS